jgi:hypothetical protein
MKNLLFKPKDIVSLVIFRVAFGMIMFWEVLRYFEHDWIKKYWIEPSFHFTYEGFDWVNPWPGDGMYAHFVVLGGLSLLIMFGLFYRLATVLMFFSISYIFLLEQSTYLNHLYLICLISFLLIFIPAHKNYSLDSWLWKKIKSDYVPAWTIYLLAFQIGVAYFFGGIAKLNYDWLMLAEPMQHWLSDSTDFPLIGQYFDEPWMAYCMAWAGLFLDLLAPFFLSIRRTRPFIFVAILSFHFMNDQMFNIGIFPWFMIVVSTIFFPADWLKQLINRAQQNRRREGAIILAAALIFSVIGTYFHIKTDRGFELVPFLVAGFGGGVLMWLVIDLFVKQAPDKMNDKKVERPGKKVETAIVPTFAYKPLIVGLLGIWGFVQIAMPLRHYFIPGNVSWTEEGHRFSWHMKLRSKNGELKIFIYDPLTNTKEIVYPSDYMKRWQYENMVTKPYLLLQFAKYLDNELVKQGKVFHQILVEASAGLNYRKLQPFIDPKADISKQTFSEFRHNAWIIQMDETQKPLSVSSTEALEQNLE